MSKVKRSDSDEDSRKKKFSTHACSVLSELRRSGQLCDGVIKVDGQKFPIHRAILAASSPYFRAFFTNQYFNRTAPNVADVSNVSALIMDIIIEYAYTRDINIKVETVLDIIAAADFFMIESLVRECCDFILSQMDHTNCIGFWTYAKQKGLFRMEKKAFRYILENFNEVVDGIDEEFFLLTADEFVCIMKSDNLNVRDEENVFEAVVKWIDRQPFEREEFISKLLPAIRLGHMDPDYFIHNVKIHPYVKNNKECRPTVVNALKYFFNLDPASKESDKETIARKRVPHEILFLFGGWLSKDNTSTSAMEVYDTRANVWVIAPIIDQGKTNR